MVLATKTRFSVALKPSLSSETLLKQSETLFKIILFLIGPNVPFFYKTRFLLHNKFIFYLVIFHEEKNMPRAIVK